MSRKDLTGRISSAIESGEQVDAELQVDDRVLARITDGIYRKPSSALRELISNAYDADSTAVFIDTDAPRFENIKITDNGSGLSASELANLVEHIGGSAKRTKQAISLGMSDSNDPNLSKSGRRYIGKLGIGLFSVVQLTQHFQIISKKKGNSYRLFADVTMKAYHEDGRQVDSNTPYSGGNVSIWSEPAADIDSHGTEIILLQVKAQAREALQSHERWLEENMPDFDEDGDVEPLPPPKFHIGHVDRVTRSTVKRSAEPPWDVGDDPAQRMQRLFESVHGEFRRATGNPKLSELLDNYFQMLWELSLASPVDYIDGHPFDLTSANSGIQYWLLQNSTRGRALPVELAVDESLREKFSLMCPQRGELDKFCVFIDGTQLLRPISFNDLPKSSHRIKDSLLFCGKLEQDFGERPLEISGGQLLSFEAYFFWNSIIVPSEHRGVLVRIGDASGTLFDETFMTYQVSEQTRLRQITAEIFVKEGLDACLNIDRESFNKSHPHYRVLMNWVHRSLRQITNTNKFIGKQILDKSRADQVSSDIGAIEVAVEDTLREIYVDAESVPDFRLVKDHSFRGRDNDGAINLSETSILPSDITKRKGRGAPTDPVKKKIESVMRVLHAFGVLDDVSYETQERIARAIVRIFVAKGE